MNTRLPRSSPLLIALLASSACVVSGKLDETGTDGATAASGPGPAASPASDSSGALESGSSAGDGGFSCADYSPSAEGCEPAGSLTASVGYSLDTIDLIEETECAVTRIRDADDGTTELAFTCPTGTANLFVSTNSPDFSAPFSEGDSVLLTIQSQGSSSAVRSLDGELLLAYVEVEGFETDVDLGMVEIVQGLSGCPAEPDPAASCSAGGSLATQRVSLKVASGGPTGASVFDGRSEVIEQDGRSFLFLVDFAREVVCWDADCTHDAGWLDEGGAMSFLLVAQ